MLGRDRLRIEEDTQNGLQGTRITKTECKNGDTQTTDCENLEALATDGEERETRKRNPLRIQ